MKKTLITLLIICFLGFTEWIYGEVWSDTVNENDGINNIGIYNSDDVVVTFNFPYNLDNIEVQSMEVEVEAYDVDFGNPYDLTVWIYNNTKNRELLGELPADISYKKFIINNPTHYAYPYSGSPSGYEIYLKFNETQSLNVTTVFYHINGSVKNISKESDYWTKYYFWFPWSPENTTRVEIIIRKVADGGDKVFVDGNYVGNLIPGDNATTLTTFTIDKENATNILSDKTISVFIDKSNDYINVSRVTVKVHYTVAGGGVTKTPIPLGVIIITLITTPIIALKRLSS
jgi:hypothetical protein